MPALAAAAPNAPRVTSAPMHALAAASSAPREKATAASMPLPLLLELIPPIPEQATSLHVHREGAFVEPALDATHVPPAPAVDEASAATITPELRSRQSLLPPMRPMPPLPAASPTVAVSVACDDGPANAAKAAAEELVPCPSLGTPPLAPKPAEREYPLLDDWSVERECPLLNDGQEEARWKGVVSMPSAGMPARAHHTDAPLAALP